MQPAGAMPELLKNKSAQDYSLLEEKWWNHFQAFFFFFWPITSMLLLAESGFVYLAGVVLWRACDNPVLLIRDYISNQRQLSLSGVAAGSAMRILLAILSQSLAHRPWERKQRRRQPETKAVGAVAATIKAEMALAFSSVRSGFPLFLATAPLVSPLSWGSGLLPLPACSPVLLPCFWLPFWLAMRSMGMQWGMPVPQSLHRAGAAGLEAYFVSGHIQGEYG